MLERKRKGFLFFLALLNITLFLLKIQRKKSVFFDNRNQIKDELNKFIYRDAILQNNFQNDFESDFDVVLYNRVAKCGK